MVGLSLPQVEDSINKIRAINPIPARIDALNDLAWVLRYSHKDQAYLLCREACELSQTGAFNDQPYRKGLGTGLVILGILDLARNKLDNALDQSIRALATLHQLPPIPAVVDAWLTICWIYQFLGEFPTAFDYALMGLKLARELGSKEREAYALDALGSTYGFSAEYKNSIESHEQALCIFRELGNVQAEAMALNNMACSLLDMGDYSDAYPASQKSLELAQRLGFFEEELAFTSTIADILVKLGDYEQAGRYLQQAFNKTRDRNLEATQASLLVSMARLRLAQKNYTAAEPCLTQALAVAQKYDFKNDQMICHHLLAEVYENSGSLARALDHFKQYYAIKEATSGAETARKIAMLKAANQLEISKREAEIYRKQNQALQNEIKERKRAESMLENLAIRDPLTNMLNRRQFSMLAAREIERAVRHNRALSTLMIDVDHFKLVNDRHGHLVGDQVLTSVAKTIEASLRDTDIVGRYGGDEFAVLLPETNADQAFEVAERLRISVARASYESPGGPISVTISLGITQLPNTRQATGFALDELHFQADQALYEAKRGGRNKTCTFQKKD